MSRTTRSAAVVLVCLLAVSTVTAGTGAPATGDNAAAVSFHPETVSVEPGDTVTVDVLLKTEGGHDGNGIYDAGVRIDFPADYVTVESVEPGQWFQQNGEVTLSTDTQVDNAAGVARVEQKMQNPGNGVTGEGRIATVTLTVAESADGHTLLLDATESEFILAVTQFTLPVYGTQGALEVGDGGKKVEPQAPSDFEFDEQDDSATNVPGDSRSRTATTQSSELNATTETGQSVVSSTTEEDAEDESESDSPDGGPDLGPVAGVVGAGLVAILVLAVRR